MSPLDIKQAIVHAFETQLSDVKGRELRDSLTPGQLGALERLIKHAAANAATTIAFATEEEG